MELSGKSGRILVRFICERLGPIQTRQTEMEKPQMASQWGFKALSCIKTVGSIAAIAVAEAGACGTSGSSERDERRAYARALPQVHLTMSPGVTLLSPYESR
jgi:hypothetical protein